MLGWNNKQTPCTDSQGFKAKYLTGLVAGEGESANRKIVFQIDLKVPKDKNKQYYDQEASIEIETSGFDQNMADYFFVRSNNKVVYWKDVNGV